MSSRLGLYGILSENVLRICQYGLTRDTLRPTRCEHLEGSAALVIIGRSATRVNMLVADNGVGIFEKIKSNFDLEDHRHAILELVKGKLTTDESRHTGEGIFFASRMFDHFSISSEKLIFVHDTEFGDDWLIEDEENESAGASILHSMSTVIKMTINADSTRKTQEVFDRYADPEVDDYAFSKTRVQLRLAQYGQDLLVGVFSFKVGSQAAVRAVQGSLSRFLSRGIDRSSICRRDLPRVCNRPSRDKAQCGQCQ